MPKALHDAAPELLHPHTGLGAMLFGDVTPCKRGIVVRQGPFQREGEVLTDSQRLEVVEKRARAYRLSSDPFTDMVAEVYESIAKRLRLRGVV